MERRSGKDGGFTLVELLVTMVIVLVLAVLALRVPRRAEEGAHRVTCSHNLRQIGLGLGLFVQGQGWFPGQVGDPFWDRVILPSLSG